MDAELFANMLSDKSILDLKKLRYRYPQADMKEFVALLGNGFYKKLPLKDFDGGNLVYLESIAQVHLTAVKVLLTPQNSKQLYGMKAMEEKLPSKHFVRVHRSFIVQKSKIKVIDRGRIVFGKEYIPISDSYKQEIQTYLNSHSV